MLHYWFQKTNKCLQRRLKPRQEELIYCTITYIFVLYYNYSQPIYLKLIIQYSTTTTNGLATITKLYNIVSLRTKCKSKLYD